VSKALRQSRRSDAHGQWRHPQIDNIPRQSQFARDGDNNGGKRLIDLDALDIAKLPACPCQCLPDSWDWGQTKHAGLNGGDTVGNQGCHRRQTVCLCPLTVR